MTVIQFGSFTKIAAFGENIDNMENGTGTGQGMLLFVY
jgi:hypothetical protein